MDEHTALKTIADFATDYGGLGADVISKLDRDVYALIRATSIRRRLKDPGNEALHEFGWVLHDFHELVLLDPAARRVELVVAAAELLCSEDYRDESRLYLGSIEVCCAAR